MLPYFFKSLINIIKIGVYYLYKKIHILKAKKLAFRNTTKQAGKNKIQKYNSKQISEFKKGLNRNFKQFIHGVSGHKNDLEEFDMAWIGKLLATYLDENNGIKVESGFIEFNDHTKFELDVFSESPLIIGLCAINLCEENYVELVKRLVDVQNLLNRQAQEKNASQKACKSFLFVYQISQSIENEAYKLCEKEKIVLIQSKHI